MLRKGPLRFLEKLALHSPLVVWAPAASNIYHDLLWYPTVGRARIARFRRTEWGRLFDDRYGGPSGEARAVRQPAGAPASPGSGAAPRLSDPRPVRPAARL